VKLDAHRIQLDLPAGWEGRVWKRDHGEPVVHAANFALPESDGDFGVTAAQTMPRAGVLVVLVEYEPAQAGTALFAANGPPRRLRGSDFSGKTLLHALPGQAGLQRFFTTANGRPFCLYVVIGSAADAPALAEQATTILAGLTIASA
jgi:hypothetical protein